MKDFNNIDTIYLNKSGFGEDSRLIIMREKDYEYISINKHDQEMKKKDKEIEKLKQEDKYQDHIINELVLLRKFDRIEIGKLKEENERLKKHIEDVSSIRDIEKILVDEFLQKRTVFKTAMILSNHIKGEK